MSKKLDIGSNPPVEAVEAEKVTEQNILDMMRTATPPTPYYEVQNISTTDLDEFSNYLEDAINAGNQILQMGVVEDKHYALIVVASNI